MLLILNKKEKNCKKRLSTFLNYANVPPLKKIFLHRKYMLIIQSGSANIIKIKDKIMRTEKIKFTYEYKLAINTKYYFIKI